MKQPKASDQYLDRFSGIARLYGDAALDQLRTAHIAVVGIGGVGSWTAESLARSGVGELSLIDLDSVCVTNTNRQIHALTGQVGREKVVAMADRLRLINPEIKVHEVLEFFSKETADQILASNFDAVVDAIDSVKSKCFLIATCRDKEVPLVVSGGAGGKSDPTALSRADLAFTSNDRLLKMVRRRLRRDYGFPSELSREPYGITAVFSTENAKYPWSDGTVRKIPEPGSALHLDCESGFGTAAQVTGTFGFAAAAEAIRLVVGES